MDLEFQGLPQLAHATLLRLQDLSGTTTLQSANLAPDMPGGPTLNVDWVSSDLSGQDLGHYQLTLPAATVSLLVLEPGLGRLTPTLLEQQEGGPRLGVTFQPLPYASAVRYQLLRSNDLAHWEVVDEAGPGVTGPVSLKDNQPSTGSPQSFFRVEVLPN